MGTQTITTFEIILLILFSGSIVYLLGTIYQIIALVKFNKKSSWYKILGIVILTRGIVLALSIFIWIIAFEETEMMFGPILLPGLIAEIIFSPLVLKLFRFRIY